MSQGTIGMSCVQVQSPLMSLRCKSQQLLTLYISTLHVREMIRTSYWRVLGLQWTCVTITAPCVHVHAVCGHASPHTIDPLYEMACEEIFTSMRGTFCPKRSTAWQWIRLRGWSASLERGCTFSAAGTSTGPCKAAGTFFADLQRRVLGTVLCLPSNAQNALLQCVWSRRALKRIAPAEAGTQCRWDANFRFMSSAELQV
jgi:hypothetical protein